ncbi:MAG: hypothetical protein FMNOHCHN_00607 [Ignavibacteriaceae bacterium]|nr:hypothetical protein [Ignavibacteriaceae bacterium]
MSEYLQNPLQPQQFRTADRFAEQAMKKKGSEFIARVFPLFGGEGYLTHLTALRKKYYDATHHCFAVKTIKEGVKYSDDGEPSGTAGVRILQAIDHFDLTEVLVVVTRYYGGTKLGVGPLGKAYYQSALDALSTIGTKEYHLYEKMRITFPHEFISSFYRISDRYSVRKEDEIYLEEVEQILWIRSDQTDSLRTELTESFSGRVKFKDMEEFGYY